MLPVLTPQELRAIDERALAEVSLDELVARAGAAVAAAAIELLGGAYGRRVVVIAGPGNNGADGRVAARLLAQRGVKVEVVGPATAEIGPCDLVIDAAYGTGMRGEYAAPLLRVPCPVLAVDVPSGIDATTGALRGRPLAATRTITMVATKPGLLQGAGARLAGQVTVADIGLRPEAAPSIGLVEDRDLAWLPGRGQDAHKWHSAVLVVAGSPGMTGAAVLASAAAMRAGAGMVRLAVPGVSEPMGPIEVVQESVPELFWAGAALAAAQRCRAVVVGPGLGRHEHTAASVKALVAGSPVPLVIDADGLAALGHVTADGAPALRRPDGPPIILTPHDGEYDALVGCPPGEDRIAAARWLADRTGAVALVKGSLTVVAEPLGRVFLINAGSSALATAGTGDVLSGIIGALLARGVPAPEAAALGAHIHGRAASLGPRHGLVAGDLPRLVARWMSGGRKGRRWHPDGGRRGYVQNPGQGRGQGQPHGRGRAHG